MCIFRIQSHDEHRIMTFREDYNVIPHIDKDKVVPVLNYAPHN